MSQPVHVTEANFNEEVVNAGVPVVLDFWAPWCGPCRSIGPVLDDLATRYAGRVKVAKVNVDQERALAGAFKIQGIPAVFAFDGEAVVDQMVGYSGRAPLDRMFERLDGAGT